MKNYLKSIVALVALVAFCNVSCYKADTYNVCIVGILLAQVAFLKIVCANNANKMPLKSSPKALLSLHCANNANNATKYLGGLGYE